MSDYGTPDLEESSVRLLNPSDYTSGGHNSGEENTFDRRLGRSAKTSAVISFLHGLSEWMKGPRIPRVFKIEPFFPGLQTLPVDFLERSVPRKRYQVGLFGLLCLLWVISFVSILSISVSKCQVEGYERPVRLACNSRLWRSSPFCGIDGSSCRPFENMTTAFRCPSVCRDTIIDSTETIGDTEYNYRSLVIGGGDPVRPVYRGDSFICAAAIHAGIVSNIRGGGGVVELVGEQSGFAAVERNGIASLDFTPSFPLSFTFMQEEENHTTTHCADPRWRLILLTVLFTFTMSVFTTSPAVFSVSVCSSTYFCVALASDPPEFADYSAVVSFAFRGFLPSVFVGLAIHHFCIRPTLTHLDAAQFEKTILWLGGCWLGALSNFTLEKLPIQRLTVHDLQQPGALLTVLIIALAIVLIAIFQARAFRIEGRLPHYLRFYGCIGLLLLALTMIPGVDLRIHHYILALLLFPGTALQTRPSLFYQGLLVGLFINGIARWGFDSILQTPADLYGDDFNTAIPPVPTPIVDNSNGNITFSWSDLRGVYDGISVLVNDVERFRGTEDLLKDVFTWTRHKETEPEYFRFAYVKKGLFDLSSTGTFTKPGTWELDGTWVPPTNPAPRH